MLPALRIHGSNSAGTEPAASSPPPTVPKPAQLIGDDKEASRTSAPSGAPGGEAVLPSLIIGSTAVPPWKRPPSQYSKCRWAPVLWPSSPMVAMWSPALTCWPSRAISPSVNMCP